MAEELSDMVWHDFDKWNKTVQKHEGQISNFYFLISAFRERLHKMFRNGLFYGHSCEHKVLWGVK